jgi:hypothetical protein
LSSGIASAALTNSLSIALIWLSAALTIVGAGGVACGEGEAWATAEFANTDNPQLRASSAQNVFILFMLVISFTSTSMISSRDPEPNSRRPGSFE